MSKFIEIEELDDLILASNYRDFIKIGLSIRTKQLKRRFGYADLARAAGFASRSFPREIVMGKKRLTIESTLKIAKGLGLNQELTTLFRSLVELENPESKLSDRTYSQSVIQRRITNLRSRIFKKNKIQIGKNDKVFEDFNLPKIYASIGVNNDLNQIAAKCSMDIDDVKTYLDRLEELNLVERTNSGKYLVTSNHLNFQDLGKNVTYKKYYIQQLSKASHVADHNFNDAASLFFNSDFSIKVSKLPELKNELRKVLLDFIDNSEDEYGDKTISLTCAMF